MLAPSQPDNHMPPRAQKGETNKKEKKIGKVPIWTKNIKLRYKDPWSKNENHLISSSSQNPQIHWICMCSIASPFTLPSVETQIQKFVFIYDVSWLWDSTLLVL